MRVFFRQLKAAIEYLRGEYKKNPKPTPQQNRETIEKAFLILAGAA